MEDTRYVPHDPFCWRSILISVSIVRIGAEDHAFKLAEEYGDYRALTELSYEIPESQTGAGRNKKDIDERVDRYIDTFKEAFAFELYQWWIEKGSVLPFS